MMREQAQEENALQLTLLYQDDWLVAVNKPSGLLVHRSWLDKAETRFAMQMTGILSAVATSTRYTGSTGPPRGAAVCPRSAVARTLTEAFAARQVHKEYLALVRGWAPSRGSSTIRSRSSWTRLPTP